MAVKTENKESIEYGEWFFYSAWSGHMTGDNLLFSSITKIKGNVTFENNSKGKINRVDNIGDKFSPSIKNVFLVNNLKHKLLNISQLCDKGYKIIFLWCKLFNSWKW